MAQIISFEQSSESAAKRVVSIQRLTPQMALILLLLLSACGAAEEANVVEPTSTPQPTVLALIFPANAANDTDTAAIAGEIRRRSGLVIDVRVVDTNGAALDAACEPSAESVPSVVWLDGLSYAVAAARACGQPVLQAGRVRVDDDFNESQSIDENAVEIIPTEETALTEEASDGVPANVFTGMPGVIVVNTDVNATDLSAVNENTFCRTDVDDLYSWLLPILIFQTENIDLTSGEITVVDIEEADPEALLQAVADGQCAMAGLSQIDAVSLPENVEILRTSPPIPFSVLVIPPELDAATRDAMIDALVTMAEDTEVSSLLLSSLQQDRLLPAAVEDFTALNDFIAGTGLNLDLINQ